MWDVGVTLIAGGIHNPVLPELSPLKRADFSGEAAQSVCKGSESRMQTERKSALFALFETLIAKKGGFFRHLLNIYGNHSEELLSDSRISFLANS